MSTAPKPPFRCPIVTYSGARDSSVRYDEVRGWAVHTTARCLLRVHAGNHRLARQVPSELFELVREDVIGALTPIGS